MLRETRDPGRQRKDKDMSDIDRKKRKSDIHKQERV